MLGGHNDLNNSKKPIRKLAYLPSLSRQYTLWYKRHLVQVIRTQAQTGFQGSKEQTLYLRYAHIASIFWLSTEISPQHNVEDESSADRNLGRSKADVCSISRELSLRLCV